MIGLQVENITNLQNVYNEIKISLAECKITKSYLYIFTKYVPYVKLTRFIKDVLERNKSKLIR